MLSNLSPIVSCHPTSRSHIITAEYAELQTKNIILQRSNERLCDKLELLQLQVALEKKQKKNVEDDFFEKEKALRKRITELEIENNALRTKYKKDQQQQQKISQPQTIAKKNLPSKQQIISQPQIIATTKNLSTRHLPIESFPINVNKL